MKNYVLFRQFTSVVLLNTKVQLSYYQIESECCFKEKHSEVFDGRSPELQSHDQKFLETQTVVNGKTEEIWGHTWKSGKC